MSVPIVIIGGGISGLSVLHYLQKKYQGRLDVRITLLEANDYLGGTARTINHEGFLFETGPNGFLSSSSTTLELIDELGIRDDLLTATVAATLRFISIQNTLYRLPNGPIDFFRFRPLPLKDKIRVFGEFLVPKGNDPQETVFEFGQRRLGRSFTEIFLDAMVTGIFAGDVKELHLASAFPKIHKIEQTYGSLMKGMLALGIKKRKSSPSRFSAMPGGQLTSLKEGMSQFVSALGLRYKDSIRLNHAAEKILRKNKRFYIYTKQNEYEAEEVFICTPAYAAAHLLKELNALADALAKIPYAPLAVVGLVYKRACFKKLPQGFGYLIPSSENKEVLGVLFTSNIFDHRTDRDHFMFQVMIGGVRHPEIIYRTKEKLVMLAKKEIEKLFKVYDNPFAEFFALWPKAIPQYNREYPAMKADIESALSHVPGLYLVANYLGGISINDCVRSAQSVTQRSNH